MNVVEGLLDMGSREISQKEAKGKKLHSDNDEIDFEKTYDSFKAKIKEKPKDIPLKENILNIAYMFYPSLVSDILNDTNMGKVIQDTSEGPDTKINDDYLLVKRSDQNINLKDELLSLEIINILKDESVPGQGGIDEGMGKFFTDLENEDGQALMAMLTEKSHYSVENPNKYKRTEDNDGSLNLSHVIRHLLVETENTENEDDPDINLFELESSKYDHEDKVDIVGERRALSEDVEDLLEADEDPKLNPEEHNLEDILFQEALNGIHYDEENGWSIDTQTSVDIVHRLSDAIYANIDEEQSEVVVHLKPDFLGKVTLKISLDENILSAKIVADSHATVDILSAQLDKLEHTLNEQGYTIGNLNVDLNQSDSEPQNFFNKQQSSSRRGRGSLISPSKGVAPEHDINYYTSDPRLTSSSDGSIDYFA